VIQRQSHEDDRAERFYGLAWRWAHLLSMFGVWTVRCMDELTNDAIREIEQVHSKWIEYEVAGDDHNLMTLCADDIELWPPNAQPLLGHAAVSAQMAHRTTRIHCIEFTHRRIRGSNEIAYLTASYKTTFSSAEDSTPREAVGTHLWILRKRAGAWIVYLVSWSFWDHSSISPFIWNQ
jgi:ketosteroid isomerase-like protein